MLGIMLPKEIFNEARLVENERVELIADKAGIRIQKIEEIKTLDDLFTGYNGNYAYQDIETDSPVGNEAQ